MHFAFSNIRFRVKMEMGHPVKNTFHDFSLTSKIVASCPKSSMHSDKEFVLVFHRDYYHSIIHDLFHGYTWRTTRRGTIVFVYQCFYTWLGVCDVLPMIGQDCNPHQSRRGKGDQGRQKAPDDVQCFSHPPFYDSEKRGKKVCMYVV